MGRVPVVGGAYACCLGNLRTLICTLAPVSGETTTSCAAGTPPAIRVASTGTVRLTSAKAIGPNS
jgi:hypothetical protein